MHKCKGNKPTATQQSYWDAKLKRFGLTVDAGRKDWLSYGHVITDLDHDRYRNVDGERIGFREWPISL